MKKQYLTSALLPDTGTETHPSQLLHLVQNSTQDRELGYKYFQGQRVISYSSSAMSSAIRKQPLCMA